MDDLISREAVKEMMKNHRVDFSTEKDYRTAKACANAVPPADSELIKCDYVKACNEVTMNKIFSAWRYLAMLDDFEEYGYILVKKEGLIHE